MGKEQLAALAKIIEEQSQEGLNSALLGTWTIRFDGKKKVLYFEKCEDGFYCEERPAVVDLEGNVLDRGGPLIPLA